MKTKTILEKIRFACRTTRNLYSGLSETCGVTKRDWGIHYDKRLGKYVLDRNNFCFCPIAALALVYQPTPEQGRETWYVDVGSVLGWTPEETAYFVWIFDWGADPSDTLKEKYSQAFEVAEKIREDYKAGRL